VTPGSPTKARESPPLSERATVMRSNDLDPYLALGVPPTATQAQITHAYRTRLRAEHPDTRRSPLSPIADERLRRVLAAYALIRDADRRANYDRASATTAPPSQRAPTSADRPYCGPVQIPITHRRNSSTVEVPPPLWAGPVRRQQ
jgi:curved DNA-binding protein CbpA